MHESSTSRTRRFDGLQKPNVRAIGPVGHRRSTYRQVGEKRNQPDHRLDDVEARRPNNRCTCGTQSVAPCACAAPMARSAFAEWEGTLVPRDTTGNACPQNSQENCSPEATDASAGGPPSDAESQSRRQFLKASVAAAGSTLLGGCLGDSASPEAQRLVERGARDVRSHRGRHVREPLARQSPRLPLYAGTIPRNQTYNGLADGEHRCPVPAYINDGHDFVSARISPGTDADMMNPNPDPGEEYQHVNTQLFNLVDPISNQFKTAGEMVAVQRAPRRPAADHGRLRVGLLQQLCRHEGPQSDVRRIPRHHGQLRRIITARDLHTGKVVRGVRRMVLRRAVADADEPRLLSRVDGLGLCRQHAVQQVAVRVPMIAVSAYTEANTVINRTVHHGSFAKMLCTKYDLPYLTERDHNAPDMSDALNLTTPRPASTWPVTVPRPVPPELSETNPLGQRGWRRVR